MRSRFSLFGSRSGRKRCAAIDDDLLHRHMACLI
jgi:hypothetical protein